MRRRPRPPPGRCGRDRCRAPAHDAPVRGHGARRGLRPRRSPGVSRAESAARACWSRSATSTRPAPSWASGAKASSKRSSGVERRRGDAVADLGAAGAVPVLRRLRACLRPDRQQALLPGEDREGGAGIVDARRERARADLGQHLEAVARILVEGALRPEGEGACGSPLRRRRPGSSWSGRGGRRDGRARRAGRRRRPGRPPRRRSSGAGRYPHAARSGPRRCGPDGRAPRSAPAASRPDWARGRGRAAPPRSARVIFEMVSASRTMSVRWSSQPKSVPMTSTMMAPAASRSTVSPAGE